MTSSRCRSCPCWRRRLPRAACLSGCGVQCSKRMKRITCRPPHAQESALQDFDLMLVQLPTRLPLRSTLATPEPGGGGGHGAEEAGGGGGGGRGGGAAGGGGRGGAAAGGGRGGKAGAKAAAGGGARAAVKVEGGDDAAAAHGAPVRGLGDCGPMAPCVHARRRWRWRRGVRTRVCACVCACMRVCCGSVPCSGRRQRETRRAQASVRARIVAARLRGEVARAPLRASDADARGRAV
jgi:hypothetical protein